MGKIKTDDKFSISGNSCKNEVKCKEENASSAASSSVPRKKRSDDVCIKLHKNNVSDKKFNLHSAKVKGADMSRTTEEVNSSSHCRPILRKMVKNKVSENEQEICTTKANEMTLNCGSSSTVACSLSKSRSQAASNKRRINDELSQRCSDEEQSTSKSSKQVGRPVPTVHIQRLNNTEPVLFSFFDKYENIERKSAKTASTKTIATDLSESNSKNCQFLDSRSFHEVSLKDEPDCHSSLAVDRQKLETFKVEQQHDCDDNRNVQVANVAVAKNGNEKASNAVIPLLTKFDEELKSAKRSSDISGERCDADYCGGLTKDKQSNEIIKNAAPDERSCSDVVLSVDSSRTKTTRKSRSDMPRKRSEADDVTCSTSTPVKLEPSDVEERLATAVISAHETGKVDAHAFICDSPDKMARTSSKNADRAKTVKKTRPVKSKQSASGGSSVSPSILTRSMIKIPG